MSLSAFKALPPPLLDSSCLNRKWGRQSPALLHVKRGSDNFMASLSGEAITQNHPLLPALAGSSWGVSRLAPGRAHRWSPHQRLVVNLLSDELVLAQRIARLSCDGVNGAFLHLLLDGTEEGEEWLARTLLEWDSGRERGRERGKEGEMLRQGQRKLWSQCQLTLMQYICICPLGRLRGALTFPICLIWPTPKGANTAASFSCSSSMFAIDSTKKRKQKLHHLMKCTWL